jgi:hypothetical protein
MVPSVLRAKYVFFDVVNFTHISPVDKQLEIVNQLTHMVRAAILVVPNLIESEVRYLPTGDGMCVALLQGTPFDAHVRLADGISHQAGLRGIQLRIGVGEGTDFMFKDINGNDNFAGVGINSTARAQSAAAPNAIFLTRDAYESVRYHHPYFEKYSGIDCSVKGVEWTFYTASLIGATVSVESLRSEKRLPVSKAALDLLHSAIQHGGGHIYFLRDGNTDLWIIQIGNYGNIPVATGRESAMWRSAVEELHEHDFVRDMDYKREAFEVTEKGYKLAEQFPEQP